MFPKEEKRCTKLTGFLRDKSRSDFLYTLERKTSVSKNL